MKNKNDIIQQTKWAGWLVAQVLKRSGLVIFIALLLTGLAFFSVYAYIGINTDTTDMLSPQLEFRQDAKAIEAAFPQRSGLLVIVIDGDSADQTDDAAILLAAELERQSSLEYFFDPVGDPHFQRAGLLYLDLDRLNDLIDRLAAAQPFLASLAQNPSLVGLSNLLYEAVTRGGDGIAGLRLEFALTQIAATIMAQAQGQSKQLSWRTLLSGRESKLEEHRRILLVKPKRDFSSLQPARASIQMVRHMVQELGLQEDPSLRIRLTGAPALADEELASVRDGMGLAGFLSLSLVIGFLFFGLKSVRLAIAILATLLLGLIWTAGFAAWIVGDLNLISVAFAVLFIGLSVDFGIHLGLRYLENLRVDRGDKDHETALIAAAQGCGNALALCAIAAAIGFFAFLPTDYRGLAELGLISGVSMFIGLATNLLLLPAFLWVMRPRYVRQESLPESVANNLNPISNHINQNFARWIIAAAALLAVLATMLAWQTRFDFDPLNLKDPTSESVSTILDLMTDADASPHMISILLPDSLTADLIKNRLEVLPEVKKIRSFSSLIPTDQQRKREAIQNINFLMQPIFYAPSHPPAPTKIARMEAWKKFRHAVFTSKETEGIKALRTAITALETSSPYPLSDAMLDMLEKRLLAGLPGRLNALRNALSPENVNADMLPSKISALYRAADGRMRLDVFPAEDLQDPAALDRFVTAVRGIAPRATGAPVTILEAGKTVVQAFLQALALSIGLITLLLLVLLRSLRDMLLVFVPMALSAVFTLAIAVLLDMTMNFANVIVLPLLFGLGVASGVHFVLRERHSNNPQALLRTSTPRAVILSAATTIASFGSMALSTHPGTASMGVLLTVALVMTLICTILVLPALMTVVPRHHAADR